MAVIRLALLALCLWYVVHASDIERKPWTKSIKCPEECTCSASSLTTMRIPPPLINKHMAQCNSIPKAMVDSSIYSIKVHGEITRITPAILDKLGKNLEVLDLSDCGITHIPKGSFDKLVKLSVLKLSNNKIETIDRDLFKKNGHLKKLFLDGNLIKEIQPGTFAKCNNLEELHLEMNHIREFPSKLPQKLTSLDLSHNDILMLNARDMGLIPLKFLNLCYNHIGIWGLDVFSSLKMIHDLCLGTEQVVLPSHTAEKVPNIAHLKLIGELTEPLPTINQITLEEIGKMKKLTTLTIENYIIGSLEFLLNHTNLMELRFVNVNVTSTNSIQMKQIFHNNPYLTKINFNRSPKLADILVNNIYMVAHLQDLQHLSMQSAEIVNLPTSFDAPNSNFRMDISHNPLHCDCRFEWLRQMDKDTMHYLIACSENTTCFTPENVHGKTLEDFVNTVDCTTGPVTEHPQVEEEDHTQMFTAVNVYDETNAEDQGTDQGDDQGTDQGDDQGTDHGDDQSEGNLSAEAAVKTDEDEDNVNQNTEDHKEGEDSQTGDAVVDTTDNKSISQEIDSQSTDYQIENSSDTGTDEINNGDQEHQIQETNNENGSGMNSDEQTNTDETSQIGSGGNHSHHHKHRSDDDQHAKIYIVLGCVLLVLVLIGVILGVIYWKYKQDGKNKVMPEFSEPPNEPIEPTYKQTLASEDTTLIKK